MSAPFAPPGARPNVARYEFRGAVLEAPAEWGEDSVLALVPNLEVSITLRRTSVEKDTTLDLFVSQQVAELAPTVDALEVEELRHASLGGQPGLRARLSWDEPEVGRIVQQLLCARFDDVIFVLSARGFPEAVKNVQGAFDTVASSFRLPLVAR